MFQKRKYQKGWHVNTAPVLFDKNDSPLAKVESINTSNEENEELNSSSVGNSVVTESILKKEIKTVITDYLLNSKQPTSLSLNLLLVQLLKR